MENKYRIIKSWDDLKADWVYCLEINNGEDMGWEKTIYTGDVDWASRESKYYNAEIVEQKKEV